MSAKSGTYALGPEHAEILLHTERQGIAGKAGHDLTIAVDRWSAEVVVAENLKQSTVKATVQLGTLRVLKGTGGVKPLSDRDKREIAANARKVLGADRYPEARFVSRRVEVRDGGGVVHGEFTLAGVARPVALTVEDLGEGRFKASATISQTEFGLTLFTAFFGTLKVADKVGVTVEVALPESS